MHVLGGNATRCHGVVTSARYLTPDATNGVTHEVPVVILPDDEAQQLLHMSGLLYSSCFKLKQVTALGQDPLARTRLDARWRDPPMGSQGCQVGA